MPKELPVDVLHNPSVDYTVLPTRPGAGLPPVDARPALDLNVQLRHIGGALHMSAFRAGHRSPKNGNHHAQLTVSAEEMTWRAARLRTVWRDRLVRYQPVDAEGMPTGGAPFSEGVDLSGQSALAHKLTTELVDEGRYLLDLLLDGSEPDIRGFRAFLLDVLAAEDDLRISFDSDLYLPWPMLAVAPTAETADDPWRAFLGYRHQVEQTGCSSYAQLQPEVVGRPLPVTSLNTDSTLEPVGRAPEVRRLLEERSRLTVRTVSDMLLDALAGPVLEDDVMYFWCHGDFVENGSPHPHLAVRLSDSRPIDADLVRLRRRHHDGSLEAQFNPFVLLNACHTGQAAAAPGLAHLGRALVDLGADGVLGPQIEIPQLFAAEYAYRFLDRYLTGDSTAGEITLALVRYFADELHNPLALAYSLHCGIDSRLEIAPWEPEPEPEPEPEAAQLEPAR